jgi:hypothetical protein
MDHLSQNIPNLASKKGLRPPVFGSLSWFYVGEGQSYQDEHGSIVTAGSVISTMAGTSRDDGTLLAGPNPLSRPIYLPASQFTLYAFDWTFDLERSIHDLQTTLLSMASSIEAEIRVEMEAASERTGEPLERLMEGPFMNRTTLILGMTFPPD